MARDNSASEAVFPTQHLENGITVRGPDGYGDFSIIFRDPDLADPMGAGLVFITRETAERIRDHLTLKISQWETPS